ncbi:hypothetical protein K435DRAFT_801943 [Dendrothele bispora CBS 962.96]|uniref:Uncharacterized protein n=1 Tax=Dendrothele bispora (strain CBS 962.96) TaxID=1314807 RepID=A0A4S8LMI8_DENBC|nr:hypothetical protein K435DRAFT_801943 [Dendrothele bispora CBS 962.96]
MPWKRQSQLIAELVLHKVGAQKSNCLLWSAKNDVGATKYTKFRDAVSDALATCHIGYSQILSSLPNATQFLADFSSVGFHWGWSVITFFERELQGETGDTEGAVYPGLSRNLIVSRVHNGKGR